MSLIKTLRAFAPLTYWMSKSYIYKFKNAGAFPAPVRFEYIGNWARETAKALNLDIRISGAPPAPHGTLMVGNHISYLDIPFIMAATPCVFVAKSEIARWPVIAQGCNVIGVVYVNRNQTKRRADNRSVIANKILNDGDNVVIFPSGTTTIDESVPWKSGPFKIAKEFNLPVQPFRLVYEPLRIAAYIEKDMLVTSMYKLLARSKPVIAKIEFGPVRYIDDVEKARTEIQAWCQEILPRKEKGE